MRKPRLLDLFCGAGGCTKGYQLAGFYVVGVDIKPQPHYCGDEFHQADALEFPLDGFDVIHASPPCQHYSSCTRDYSKHPDLYAVTRSRLYESGIPFAIENVIGAPYRYGIVLCGSMFGLEAEGEWLERHRNFETSMIVFQPDCCHPPRRAVTVTGKSFISEVREYKHSRQGTFALAQKLMGIDWMTRNELAQAIPPAYTKFIGEQLMEYLK